MANFPERAKSSQVLQGSMKKCEILIGAMSVSMRSLTETKVNLINNWILPHIAISNIDLKEN